VFFAARRRDAGVAQSVEQRIRNAWVGGSNPSTGTKTPTKTATYNAPQTSHSGRSEKVSKTSTPQRALDSASLRCFTATMCVDPTIFRDSQKPSAIPRWANRESEVYAKAPSSP
jgi:hypothetical protein